MAFIDSLREQGVLDAEQAAYLEALETRRLFSLANELRGLLYLGALFMVLGVGAVVKDYFAQLGKLTITAALSAAVAGAFYYCFTRGRPYSPDKVDSPTPAFDYILYLGCAFLGIEFGYLESQFHILEKYWDFYLLISAALFFVLAYRFDNRLVLALGIVNLGGWFGVRFQHWDIPFLSIRVRAFLYALTLIGAGRALQQARVKPHFWDTYLTFGLNVLFCTLLAGVFEHGFASLDFPALAVLTGLVIAYALQQSEFQYFLFAVIYGYVGLSYCLLEHVHEFQLIMLYLSLSATAVLVLIFRIRRSLEQKT